MERNLDRRVEVVFPVEDRGWAAEIRDEIIPAYRRDTANAWELRATAHTAGSSRLRATVRSTSIRG